MKIRIMLGKKKRPAMRSHRWSARQERRGGTEFINYYLLNIEERTWGVSRCASLEIQSCRARERRDGGGERRSGPPPDLPPRGEGSLRRKRRGGTASKDKGRDGGALGLPCTGAGLNSRLIYLSPEEQIRGIRRCANLEMQIYRSRGLRDGGGVRRRSHACGHTPCRAGQRACA